MDKTKFGLGQITIETPKWAKWTFRIFFYTTSIATIILDVFTEIPPDIKLLVTGLVVKLNLLVHGVSKLFGIDPNAI